uniref:Fatty-acid amide hydrolase 2 n=1 Tax=Aceria tosichella TaxID=561515 RepID=A0A6G1SBG0_9ACAR
MLNYKSLKTLGVLIAKRTLCYTLNSLAYLMSFLFQPKRSQIPVIDDHNLVTPAIKLSQQIKAGHISSEEVVESFINRIKLINPIINAVVDRRFELALSRARAIDRKLEEARDNDDADQSMMKLPLVGVPVSVKETIAMDGYSFTGGVIGRRHVKAPRTAEVVQLLLKNGLVPIATTNVPELAMWWDSSNPVYGTTNNPYDLTRIPGGSSGGEAALIAAGGSVVGIGSDLAGSIRIPANFCCLFGHKPTPWIVPNDGMYPTVGGVREKLFGVGPITRYACDLKPMLKIMAGPKADRLKLDEPVDLSKLKIYYVEELGDAMALECNTDILEGMHNAIDRLANKYKCHVEKIFIEEFRHGFSLWSAEANAEPDAPSFASQLGDASGSDFSPLLELGKKLFNSSDHNMGSILASALDQFAPESGSSESLSLSQQAADLRKRLNALLGDYGILMVPTHPEPAPEHHTTYLKVFNIAYTSVTTVLQAPITQVPLGLSKEGLPYGVQLVARPLNDRLPLAVALEIEKLIGGWQPPCRIDL